MNEFSIKERATILIDIVVGKFSDVEAARVYGVPVQEIHRWREEFLRGPDFGCEEEPPESQGCRG